MLCHFLQKQTTEGKGTNIHDAITQGPLSRPYVVPLPTEVHHRRQNKTSEHSYKVIIAKGAQIVTQIISIYNAKALDA